MSRRKAKTNHASIVGLLMVFLFIVSSCSPDKKEAEPRPKKSNLTTQTKAADTQTDTVFPSTLYSNVVEKKANMPNEIEDESESGIVSNTLKSASKSSNMASSSSKPLATKSPQTKEQKKQHHLKNSFHQLLVHAHVPLVVIALVRAVGDIALLAAGINGTDEQTPNCSHPSHSNAHTGQAIIALGSGPAGII